jgi:3',5'-cyclic AMP phosphodiesterase CpdA
MRIVILSDTHITPVAPAFWDNARAARGWIDTLAPDAVIHLGDITAHGKAEEIAAVQAVFGTLSPPVCWLPGNHDIGDNPGPRSDEPLDPVRLARFRAVLGPDRWSLDRRGWQIIGLNAQLFGSATTEEQEQDAWLDEALLRCQAPLGLMLHKPLFRDGHADIEEHPRYVPLAARRRLVARLSRRDLRFVASGHTHQRRHIVADGVEHVWAPSLAYRIPNALQETVGEKVVGATILELTEQGHRFTFVVPPGVVSHDLADHIDLYPELAPRLRAAQSA